MKPMLVLLSLCACPGPTALPKMPPPEYEAPRVYDPGKNIDSQSGGEEEAEPVETEAPPPTTRSAVPPSSASAPPIAPPGSASAAPVAPPPP